MVQVKPTPKKVTRDRTPNIVAKVTDDEKLSKDNIGLFLDGRMIQDYDYDPETGMLTYTCRRLKLGWHQVGIVATDAAGLEATETVRFRVVLR